MLFASAGRAMIEDGPGAARRAAGTLESEALAILRAAGQALTPGEVRERLAGQRELTYSTVVTIVSRLHAKGMLSRQRAGRGFCYAPVDAASLAAGRMSDALSSGPGRDAVLSRFVSGLSGRDAELLRQLLGDDGAAGNGSGPAGVAPGPGAE
jgi:predicted transcriptional regulator